MAELTPALNQHDVRTAAETTPGRIEEIKVIPQTGQLVIELIGTLKRACRGDFSNAKRALACLGPG